MTLPSSVKIMGETFTIRLSESIEVDGEPAHGSFDYDKHEIEVDANLEPHKAMSTLIHEMAHAWLDASSIAKFLGMDEEKEEGFILAFERQFLPAIAEVLSSTLLTSAPKKKSRKKKAD
jgi:Zn-dependent peptidase ImmA (M78 family)